MIQYTITHKTEYIYREPIALCHNIARLIPRSVNGQVCSMSEIVITPKPDTYKRYEDFFGNHVAYFAIEQDHSKLTVTVTSNIEITPGTLQFNEYPTEAWEHVAAKLLTNTEENIEVRQYIPETGMTEITPEIKDYALQSFTPGRPLFEATYDLMQRIYKDFEFKAGLTTVATPVKETLKLRKGVCQDFAHLAITCLRSVGLPARYISGYIETISKPGKEKLVGADASHAWFSVYIPGAGWVDFDPTNNQIPSSQHITIGWGRDYADIAPLKGIILSSRPHKLLVSVDVKRVN
ncbi:transglutaminase family protein [Ferruginibacter lapsinanis]|uniref:transglutaminase family protein n=1 Tax=Ferruginibacter lapsinanis TaxID=563172 RepID=UPI001E358B42|nr:transglutaminase family protein [Ferruginibacter lapsinanis]UEG50076.1 transglutaminase family protein [Ferruginibacter lapsinanis]